MNLITYNDKQSILFQIERIRTRTPKALAEEYFILLATLYGRRIESGDMRLQNYAKMTMFDIDEEVRVRTNIWRAENKRKIEQYKAKQKADQDKAIQALLILQ